MCIVHRSFKHALELACVVSIAWGQFLFACECPWRGPFLTVAPGSPLVVRAKVLAYHGEGAAKEQPLAMDVEILEVLRGEAPASPLRVWGDNGMLCRPYVSRFPVGTEWIFALNGPGSKPGMSPGPAISVCGEYWLRVTGSMAVGNLDDASESNASQENSLCELRLRLAAAPASGTSPQGRAHATFSGEVRAGEPFERRFGPCLSFRLEPVPSGWQIAVREQGRDEDLSRLTPPFHFVPNPRDIEGWHFRNSDNTGANESGERNVNAPGEIREFIFSPEVGRTIQGPRARVEVSPEEVEAVRRFGEGTVRILEYRLDNLEPGRQARMVWMRFAAELAWSEEAQVAQGSATAVPPEGDAALRHHGGLVSGPTLLPHR